MFPGVSMKIIFIVCFFFSGFVLGGEELSSGTSSLTNKSYEDPLFKAASEAYFRDDYKTAFQLFTRSAQNGNTTSKYNLGIMYYSGKGRVKDINLAYSWMKKAADDGNALAQRHLGTMYKDGVLGQPDLFSAKKWFTLSAEQGDKKSVEELALIKCLHNASTVLLGEKVKCLSRNKVSKLFSKPVFKNNGENKLPYDSFKTTVFKGSDGVIFRYIGADVAIIQVHYGVDLGGYKFADVRRYWEYLYGKPESTYGIKDDGMVAYNWRFLDGVSLRLQWEKGGKVQAVFTNKITSK